MRRVGREGRAITKSFSYPKSKDDMIIEVENIARREGTFFSDIVLELLEKYYLEHAKSQNPQTQIDLFETGLENAIPNIYRIIKNPDLITSFYSKITKKKDFHELDKGLNIWLSAHNKRDKEITK